MVKSEMKEEGKEVSFKKLCKWFKIPRSTVYYKPKKASSRISRPLNQILVQKIREIIDKNPTYGVRRITAVVRKKMQKAINRKAVHRIMKKNGWQIYKKSTSSKKRASQMKSQAIFSNERWAIDVTSIFCGKDGWCSFTAIIDCCDRHIVGWRLAESGVSKHAAAALEEALIIRKEELKSTELTLRSDNGLIFGSKIFVSIVSNWGIGQEYITPYTPEQNGLIERFFRSLKEECVWQHQFNSRDEAFVIISNWLDKYHKERPHSALNYLTPEEFKKRLRVA